MGERQFHANSMRQSSRYRLAGRNLAKRYGAGVQVHNLYDFDVREWVLGQLKTRKLAVAKAILTARAFEKTVAEMSDEQFMMIVKLA